ncbi:twin-arginine translocase TatA/TatE family subunit [Alkaliphilus crotonatoxidans]
MFGRLGAAELVLIASLAIIIFGPNKIPEIAKSVGKGVKEIKNTKKEIKDSINIIDINVIDKDK